ncbi:MAG: elaC [Pedosphaera sp.]|nr:elaC [Pedosphaera sp.]
MGQVWVKCFGVGDGWPCADRKHASFLYQVGKASILIDCGEPIDSSFKATGLSYDTIDRILISHLHSDHIGGFPMFMQGFWLEERKKELPVHMPAEGIKPIGELLKASYIFEELLSFKLRFETLQVRKPIMTKGVRITPYHTAHLEGLRKSFQKKYRQKFEAFSFLIEAGKLRIAHSADIGKPEDLAPLLTKPLDLLVCELAHFEAEDLFVYLREHKIKRLAFTHLARPLWENLKKTKQLAAKCLPGVDITFLRDGDEIGF